MIDVRVSNSKLFIRALGIIRELAGVSEDAANEALLCALYGVDEVNDEIRRYPISKHIERGVTSQQVVPKALLLAKKKFSSYEDAAKALSQQPIVRKLLIQHL